MPWHTLVKLFKSHHFFCYTLSNVHFFVCILSFYFLVPLMVNKDVHSDGDHLTGASNIGGYEKSQFLAKSRFIRELIYVIGARILWNELA